MDARYPQINDFLGPYKGERYNLSEFRQCDKPTCYQELFNHTHSSLRSVIERTFGVWKKRWKILRDMPSYPFAKQVKIVIATMTLHNYIMRHAQRDLHFDNIENDPTSIFDEGIERDNNSQEEYHNINGSGSQEMENLRNFITKNLL